VARFSHIELPTRDKTPTSEAVMWLLIVALASVVTSLVVGRLLAHAVATQTNPRPVRGPSLDDGFHSDRLAIAADAARARFAGHAIHLN
jgi:hypothetical protein